MARREGFEPSTLSSEDSYCLPLVRVGEDRLRPRRATGHPDNVVFTARRSGSPAGRWVRPPLTRHRRATSDDPAASPRRIPIRLRPARSARAEVTTTVPRGTSFRDARPLRNCLTRRERGAPRGASRPAEASPQQDGHPSQRQERPVWPHRALPDTASNTTAAIPAVPVATNSAVSASG